MRSGIAVLAVVLLAHGALAQDKPPELTSAGKAILQSKLAVEQGPFGRPLTFPLAMCAFPDGLCGAVRRDGSVAVPPQYDWVSTFSDNRAAVRLNGLYGFVDEDGREVVKPQYRVVDDYHFGFAQVDVDGKSGLIDRDGKMVVEPKYGFIRALAPDRFEVSDIRQLNGMKGGEDFSGLFDFATAVIDLSGLWIEPRRNPGFDKDDPSIRWVQKDKLWGLAHADGSWLIEPKFANVDGLSDGLARVTQNGKVGFIDGAGRWAIAPVFDKAWPFSRGLGRTPAVQDGTAGVINQSGAWVFQTDYQEIRLATDFARDRSSVVFGWHFKKADKWGLLDLDGRVVLEADFDQSLQRCHDGRLIAYKNKEWLYFKADGGPLQPPDGRLTDAACGATPPYTLKIGDKFGLVDSDSKPITPIQFDAAVTCGSGARNVKIDGKWGRIGPDGRWLLEPKFDYLYGCLDVLVASIDGKRGVMRSDSSWLIEPKFDAARRRNDETAFVTVSGATGVLRLNDQSWAIPPRPGAMCDINYAIMAQSEGKRAILSPAGETWIDVDAERLGISLDFGLLTFLKDGKWGLIDTVGKTVVEPTFEEPVFFVPGLRGIAWAKREGNWCAIDRRGRLVSDIPCAATDPTGWVGNNRFVCKVEP